MKKARKIALFLVAALIFTIIPSNIVSALKIGDEIGDVLNTDIKTYIDGERIPSYNINGKSAVLIKDLKNYGFDSFYDNIARTSTIKFNPTKKFTPMTDFDEQTGKIGTVAFNYVYTDIVAIINGEEIESFNIKGNLAVFFTDLRVFGKMEWDGEKRESKLTLSTPVSGISLNRTSASIRVDEIIHLTPAITPADATDKSVTWTSSNENVALVVNGRIVGISAGTATITATSSNGKTATCTVTVTSAILVSSFSFDITAATVRANESIVITPYLYPANATDKTLTWTSSNQNVARVDTYGRVTGIASGTATITATTSNGLTARCTVTVTVVTPVTSISLDTSSTTIIVGEYTDLYASIRPSNATDKTVTWYSSNQNVARVDSYGRVTGVASGSATITAESSNGLTAKCTVTVSSAVEIQINQSNQTIEAGGSRQFSATVYPSNAYSSITWSSNSSYVTFDYEYGSTVTVRVSSSAPAGHTATITASVYTSNGNYLAQSSRTITVSSYWDATGVYLSPSTISSLPVGDSRTITAYLDSYQNYNYYVTWSASNYSRVSISNTTGYSTTVTGLTSGSATVTATVYASYGGAYIGSATCTIEVTAGTTVVVTDVSLNQTFVSANAGSTVYLSATVAPTGASQSVTWHSSDTSVATVNNGTVTIKAGTGGSTITITAFSATDPTKYATCTITVNSAP